MCKTTGGKNAPRKKKLINEEERMETDVKNNLG